jgi:hypothetical protein
MKYTAYPGDPAPVESCGGGGPAPHDWFLVYSVARGAHRRCLRCGAELFSRSDGTRTLFEPEAREGVAE